MIKMKIIGALEAVRDELEAQHTLLDDIKGLIIELRDDQTEFRGHVIQEMDRVGTRIKRQGERIDELARQVGLGPPET